MHLSKMPDPINQNDIPNIVRHHFRQGSANDDGKWEVVVNYFFIKKVISAVTFPLILIADCRGFFTPIEGVLHEL